MSFSQFSEVNVVFKVWNENPVGKLTSSQSDNLVSSLFFSIELLDSDGNRLIVDGLNPPLNFAFTSSHSSDPSMVPTCSYWNTIDFIWETRGCSLISSSDLSSGIANVSCKCTHMTDFAVIYKPSLTDPGEFKFSDIQCRDW